MPLASKAKDETSGGLGGVVQLDVSAWLHQERGRHLGAR